MLSARLYLTGVILLSGTVVNKATMTGESGIGVRFCC
jgi:hypothetical protein